MSWDTSKFGGGHPAALLSAIQEKLSPTVWDARNGPNGSICSIAFGPTLYYHALRVRGRLQQGTDQADTHAATLRTLGFCD